MVGQGRMVTAGKARDKTPDATRRRWRDRGRIATYEGLQAASKRARETGPMRGRTTLPKALVRAWARFRGARRT